VLGKVLGTHGKAPRVDRWNGDSVVKNDEPPANGPRPKPPPRRSNAAVQACPQETALSKSKLSGAASEPDVLVSRSPRPRRWLRRGARPSRVSSQSKRLIGTQMGASPWGAASGRTASAPQLGAFRSAPLRQEAYNGHRPPGDSLGLSD
jgi:hypothetical protein